MADTCLDSNLLTYSGTSQLQRLLDALNATYAQVDERSAADLILFAKKYAAYLNYYNDENIPNGDWQSFMSMDAAVIIAAVADWRAKDFMPYVAHVNTTLQGETIDNDAKKIFKTLFDFAFTLAVDLNSNLKNLSNDISFRKYVSIAIASNLALPLNALQKYYTDFKTANLIDETVDYTDPLIPVDNVVFSEYFKLSNLSSEWQIPSFAAPDITLGPLADIIPNINLIITHNLFTGALQAFLNGIIKIVSDASSYLDDVLKNYSLHQPHYALYLSFLRLFQFAQKRLNNYTQEHLDFYYKNVLQLSNASATPDFVHLLFELQKNVTDPILKKGTAFKAGKDAKNNELFYTLTDDVVLHQSAVQSLKSLFLKNDSKSVLYASPVANSDDGNGAKLQSVDKSWNAFFNSDKIQPAVIGFAIASNLLYLNEGSRTVTIGFKCGDTSDTTGITEAAFQGKCNMQFTGKKKWFDPHDFDPTSSVICNISDPKNFSLTINIPGNAPQIIPYAVKIHGGNFTQALPMLQLQLTGYDAYAALKKMEIAAVTITVTANDVKNISLQNDEGKLDGSKPFKPFGEFPENGASFIVGSNEIFQKPLTALSFNTVWQSAPDLTETVDAIALKNADWQPAFKNSVDISGSSFSLSNLQSIPLAAPDFSDNENYAVTSVAGFIKLEFNATQYSLSNYLTTVKNSLSQTSVTLTKDSSNNVTGFTLSTPAVQEPPPQPLLKSISINYTAAKTFALDDAAVFNSRSDFFYHIEPFGYREMHEALIGQSTYEKATLLPAFNLDNQDGSTNTGGELWIGLDKADVPETFSILLQVADGTSNPLAAATVVNWFYLSANNWLLFDKQNVIDQTYNLTRSGIVILSVPKDVVMASTRADNSLLWVKAVVTHNTDAVCKLITVTANAAKATFLQDIAKNIVYTAPLAPGTISKPAVALAALKKTNQPYASFDGRVAETDSQFYVRVSERLRHKHRAVTMWDYERLVLQNYPQIHKVKCINHTGMIVDKANNKKYSEMLPGHVTIVTIPDLQNNTTSNLLKPYTSIGLLTEIQKFLQQLTTPFVFSNFDDATLNRLHVINPQFEEVQFEFSVAFKPATLDITVYTKQLNTDIEQFLTPWAYSTGKDIEFGNKIEKSVVLNFIEERDYVDYVTCMTMRQIIRDDNGNIAQTLSNLEEAIPSTARSILVSYNDGTTRHLITSPANCNC